MAAKKPTPPKVTKPKATAPPPPKSSKPPKCPPGEKKRKPGTFASGGGHAVFSDCPMPAGDYMRAWTKKNSRYNLVLITGALACFGGWGMAISSGRIR